MTGANRARTDLAASNKRPLVAPLLVLLFLTVSVIGFGFQRRAASHNDAYDAGLDTFRVLEIRAEMAWLHLDLLISGLDAEFAGSEPSAEELAAFSEARAVAIAELTEIAARESAAGDVADELLFGYADNTAAYQSGWPFPASALDYDHFTSTDPGFNPSPDLEVRRIDDSIALGLLPRLVLLDALALALDDRPEPTPEWAFDYVDYTAAVVRDTPGWFGPDRADPLGESVMGPGRLPMATSSLSSYTELQRVWDYDNWLLGYAEDGPIGPPPLTIEALRGNEAIASAALDGVVLQQIGTGRGEPADSGPLSEGQWFLVSILSGVTAVIAGTIHFMRRRMRHLHLADAVFTDSLTGAKNRRYLSEELQDRCRRRNTHHVVAMIDLDRFKMVNDTWGHDVGDTILITAAERLTAVVDAVTSPWPQADGSVVRLGGDEFAVVLQSPDRFNLSAIEAAFRAIAGPIDVGVGTPVSLELSVGLAESFEPIDIHDLLKGADLAVYRDKRGVTATNADSSPTGPPPMSVDLR